MKEPVVVTLEADGAMAMDRRGVAVRFAAATAFAALTALGARVQIPLPFTPVPVTGQVFCVLLAGCVLGPRLGFLSQLEYLAAGAAGLPVFAFGGGLGALLGPTGGYLVGFPVAALVAGAVSSSRLSAGRWWQLAACLCGVAAIHIFGACWFAIWVAATGMGAGLLQIVRLAVVPFIGVDAGKAVLVTWVAPGLRRRLLSA